MHHYQDENSSAVVTFERTKHNIIYHIYITTVFQTASFNSFQRLESLAL